jgi:serine/threonine protein phosphatase PrpC
MYVHSISLLGKRPTNEDQHLAILNLDSNKPDYAPINLFCVFDGHGGNKISYFLVKNLYKYFVQIGTTYPMSSEHIANISDKLQNQIKEVYKENSKHMGSTCLVIIQYIKHNKQYLQIINVGDSRAILNQGGFAIPLTKDHKPNKFDEKNRILQLGGKVTFDGFDYRVNDISVSRSFGDVAAAPYITHRPEITRRELCNNDKFIVLACDGLWDVMNPEQVVDFILEQMYIDPKTGILTCRDKRKNIANLLAREAIKRGSLDNISIIIVFLE